MKEFTSNLIKFVGLIAFAMMNGCGGGEQKPESCPDSLKKAYSEKIGTGLKINLFPPTEPIEKKIELIRNVRGHCKVLLAFEDKHDGCSLDGKEIYKKDLIKDCDKVIVEDCSPDLNSDITSFTTGLQKLAKDIITMTLADQATEKAKLKTQCQNILSKYPTVESCLSDISHYKKDELDLACKKL